jgi:hypothetical protein
MVVSGRDEGSAGIGLPGRDESVKVMFERRHGVDEEQFKAVVRAIAQTTPTELVPGVFSASVNSDRIQELTEVAQVSINERKFPMA